MASAINQFHPSDGLSYDLSEFLEIFKAKKSFQFLDFAAVWRDLNFFELIYGRLSMTAIKDFLNCLFHYLVDLIQNTSDKLCQTCALYMMYGFYGKLPCKNIIFITVTLPQWKTIMELVQFYREEEHLDCLYVFHSLCCSGAFLFCATRQPNYPNVPLYANLNNIRSIIFKTEQETYDKNDNDDSYIMNSLQKISETFTKYFACKKELFPIAENSLGFLNEHYIDDLIDCYKETLNKNKTIYTDTNYPNNPSNTDDYSGSRQPQKKRKHELNKNVKLA